MSPAAGFCKGQIRGWSQQGQNSPLCSHTSYHSLSCNVINGLMCLADFINIHIPEIMKVSLEARVGFFFFAFFFFFRNDSSGLRILSDLLFVLQTPEKCFLIASMNKVPMFKHVDLTFFFLFFLIP